MEDIQVVDCKVKQEVLEVHGSDRLPKILVDDLAELGDEWVGSWVGFGRVVDEGVFVDEVVKEALPILEDGNPLVELSRVDIPNIFKS